MPRREMRVSCFEFRNFDRQGAQHDARHTRREHRPLVASKASRFSFDICGWLESQDPWRGKKY